MAGSTAGPDLAKVLTDEIIRRSRKAGFPVFVGIACYLIGSQHARLLGVMLKVLVALGSQIDS